MQATAWLLLAALAATATVSGVLSMRLPVPLGSGDSSDGDRRGAELADRRLLLLQSAEAESAEEEEEQQQHRRTPAGRMARRSWQQLAARSSAAGGSVAAPADFNRRLSDLINSQVKYAPTQLRW